MPLQHREAPLLQPPMTTSLTQPNLNDKKKKIQEDSVSKYQVP